MLYSTEVMSPPVAPEDIAAIRDELKRNLTEAFPRRGRYNPAFRGFELDVRGRAGFEEADRA
jgi:hypothetical protein